MDDDRTWMDSALRLARAAAKRGEVPIGAVVVAGDRILGRGANRPIAAHDPTAHAEIVALRRAARAAGNYRLGGATLYVTLEPCLMCLGAMVHARIKRLVFGARDPRIGAVALLRAPRAARLNHRFTVTPGVRARECGNLLRQFFHRRRGPHRPASPHGAPIS
jgi:tRNA(Arg) A34 adenosine deaminase TadA